MSEGGRFLNRLKNMYNELDKPEDIKQLYDHVHANWFCYFDCCNDNYDRFDFQLNQCNECKKVLLLKSTLDELYVKNSINNVLGINDLSNIVYGYI